MQERKEKNNKEASQQSVVYSISNPLGQICLNDLGTSKDDPPSNLNYHPHFSIRGEGGALFLLCHLIRTA